MTDVMVSGSESDSESDTIEKLETYNDQLDKNIY